MPAKGNYKDYSGKKFNRLLCIKFIDIKNKARFLWRCDCGKELICTSAEIITKTGKKSCGCLKLEAASQNLKNWHKKSYKEKGHRGKLKGDSYNYLKRPDHPNASIEGYYAEHRLVAEKMIDRILLRREIVHHWDENPKNNKPDNLCVFRNNASHTRLHAFARRHRIDIVSLKFSQSWLCK